MNKRATYVALMVFFVGLSSSKTLSNSQSEKFLSKNQQAGDHSKNVDSAGLFYWEIKNETNHRTLKITSDQDTVYIEPGETKQVPRIKSFKFTVGYHDKYSDKKNRQIFTIKDHALGVYSRYFGKQGKLQFLIGITKQKQAK